MLQTATAFIASARSCPVPREGHSFTQSQEQNTCKDNVQPLSEPQTLFLDTQDIFTYLGA